MRATDNDSMPPAIPFVLRRLSPADAGSYRALMLDAYARHPQAFTSSEAERAAQPGDWWAWRLAPTDDLREPGVVIGGFDGETLAGVVGASRQAGEKTAHKALVWGMAVRDSHRGRGLGRALLAQALAALRGVPGVALVQLTVSAGNHVALRLYERAGFERWGVEPCAIRDAGRCIDKIHLWRRLERDPLPSAPTVAPATQALVRRP